MATRFWDRFTGSVRVRTTLAATLVVAIALSVSGAILLQVFRTSLEHNRKDAAIARAADIANLAASGHLPAVLGLPNEDSSFAQVVDSQGRVIAASANIAGEPPVGPPLSGGAGPIVHSVQHDPLVDGGRSGLVSLTARLAGQPVTVYTAFSYQISDLAVRDVTVGLGFGLPLLLVVVAATTWIFVGRAFRPIQAIRAEVAEITTHDLHRRVPESAAGDEVAQLARTMNSMLDRLESSVERQRAFVADASHELRSPLASLRAQLEIGLARGVDTDWLATVTDALCDEARIERLVADLLILARLDSDHLPTDNVAVDLGAVVTTELAARPARPGVSIQTNIQRATLIKMSGELARRVTTNLVDNAQRHAHRDVVVTVAHFGDGLVRMTVTDDGPGIAPEDRQRVFERFTRLDNARTSDFGGAGLGLAIVRDIVTRHGGAVSFVNAARGACVEVLVPSVSAQPPPSADSGTKTTRDSLTDGTARAAPGEDHQAGAGASQPPSPVRGPGA